MRILVAVVRGRDYQPEGVDSSSTSSPSSPTLLRCHGVGQELGTPSTTIHHMIRFSHEMIEKEN